MDRYVLFTIFLPIAHVAFSDDSRQAPSPDCFCPLYYDPVCGTDGRTYGNSCQLGCAGVGFAYEGECQSSPSCPCPKIYDPVCGIDGRTYSNFCLLQCARVKLAYYGECEKCPQPTIFCFAPPCLVTTCPGFPNARCVNGCNCRARFFIGRLEVTNFCRGLKHDS